MILASLLSSSKYIIVNKDLIKMLGLHEAVILGELCSEYCYWENNNRLEDDGYFYSTRENIEKNTGINAHFQKIAFKNLEERQIVFSKKMGIPCKKYYKLNENKIIECLKMAKLPVGNEVMNKEETSLSTIPTSDTVQDENMVLINNNNIINNINNNKEHTHNQTETEEKIEYAKLVTMTKGEYQDLINCYGNELAMQLIEQLSLYKQSHGKSYDNDYAAILYWVTERIRELEKKDSKNRIDNNLKLQKTNFNQREYPPGFFDNLYANKN